VSAVRLRPLPLSRPDRALFEPFRRRKCAGAALRRISTETGVIPGKIERVFGKQSESRPETLAGWGKSQCFAGCGRSASSTLREQICSRTDDDQSACLVAQRGARRKPFLRRAIGCSARAAADSSKYGTTRGSLYSRKGRRPIRGEQSPRK